MAKRQFMPRWRLMVGILTVVVCLGACSKASGPRVVATRSADGQQLASGPDPTLPSEVDSSQQLQQAIDAGDDVVPTVRAPRPARAASGPATPRAPRTASAPRASGGSSRPASGHAVGSAGGSGPWNPGPDAAGQWAVVIGVTNYTSPTHDTFGGVGDANAFMEALRRSGWARDHVLLLTDGAASGDAMRNAMQWLVNHSTPNTFSIFHYSGHVKQKGVGNEYLWSANNQFIPNTEFGSYMSKVQGRAWIDVAGCEAAGFDKGISSPNRLFTAASRVTEKGYENPEWHESMWIGLSVDQGILQGAADENHDGRVSIQEAVRYGANKAPALTQGQSHGPQHPVLAGGDGDGWFLGRPAPPPPPPAAGGSGGGGGGGGGGATTTTQPPDTCATVTLGIYKCNRPN
jgi:hypothetical protein